MSLEKTYQTYKDRADFYLIYLKEAHASDGRRPSRKVEITQHKTYAERLDAAKGCVAEGKATLDGKLDELGVTGTEIRDRTHRLVELTTAVYMLKLAGIDVSLEEQAIAASKASLTAAGGIALVDAARDAAYAMMKSGFKAVLGLLL